MLYNLAGNPVRLDGKAVPHGGAPGTENERSFIMIKPDGVSRQLVGQIIARFEARGYKLVGLKLVTPSKELAEKHYADLSSRPFFPGLVKYITEGTPVVAMVWEGKDVIKQGRAMLGATNPQESAPGTIWSEVTWAPLKGSQLQSNAFQPRCLHWLGSLKCQEQPVSCSRLISTQSCKCQRLRMYKQLALAIHMHVSEQMWAAKPPEMSYAVRLGAT